MKAPVPKALRPSPKRPGQDRNGKNGRNGAPPAEPTAKDHVIEGTATAVGWLDERTGATPFLRGFLYRKVPKGTNWYYTPSVTEAYESTRRITNEIFLGEFVRGMHKWGSTVMVIFIFLHMGRVFFFGAYKYPRELNWIIGVLLLILTMVMGFTLSLIHI